MEMKTVLLTATYLVGIGELFLAVFFWATHSKSEIRKVMALLALSTGLWAISNAITSYTNPSLWIGFNLRFLFVAGLFITFSLLYFSLLFPYKKVELNKLNIFLIALPAIIFSAILLSTNTVINGYTVSQAYVGDVIRGPLFIHYALVVTCYYFLSIYFLLYKYKNLDGIHKTNSRIAALGILLGGIPAIVSTLSYSVFGVAINALVVVIFSFFWIASTSYILMKR